MSPINGAPSRPKKRFINGGRRHIRCKFIHALHSKHVYALLSRMSFCIFFMLIFFPNFQPYLCEASYILLEYARTCMFMWMFIEGLYLHNVVTVTVFQGRFPHTLYAMVGWGGPVALTAIWAVTTAQYVGQQKWVERGTVPHRIITNHIIFIIIAPQKSSTSLFHGSSFIIYCLLQSEVLLIVNLASGRGFSNAGFSLILIIYHQ